MTTVRPRVAGASVAFLVGRRLFGVKDDFLDQAQVWMKQIQSAAGAGVFVEDLDDPRVVANTIADLSAKAAKAKISDATLAKNLGGLQGHTLVFTTHGLLPLVSSTKQQKLDSQGLLFINKTQGQSDNDVVLQKFHLDHMLVNSKGHVVFDDKSITDNKANEKIIGDVIDFALVVDAIRQAVFDQVYLAACGDDSRLLEFAQRLQTLTASTIFFNDEKILLPEKPNVPFAEVGHKAGKQVVRAMGFKYYESQAGKASQPLFSATDGFLPGSMRRLP
jgi:hypothetical protein